MKSNLVAVINNTQDGVTVENEESVIYFSSKIWEGLLSGEEGRQIKVFCSPSYHHPSDFEEKNNFSWVTEGERESYRPDWLISGVVDACVNGGDLQIKGMFFNSNGEISEVMDLICPVMENALGRKYFQSWSLQE